MEETVLEAQAIWYLSASRTPGIDLGLGGSGEGKRLTGDPLCIGASTARRPLDDIHVPRLILSSVRLIATIKKRHWSLFNERMQLGWSQD